MASTDHPTTYDVANDAANITERGRASIDQTLNERGDRPFWRPVATRWVADGIADVTAPARPSWRTVYAYRQPITCTARKDVATKTTTVTWPPLTPVRLNGSQRGREGRGYLCTLVSNL